ncbi:MAG TPA: NAD(P)/FAD-dependent oxidoreductase [Solirubrobacteraceae bacterium]|nr:NAD(P)/FAD-dependent oxidoreductase [Solirubrobacteraceae bacterium]
MTVRRTKRGAERSPLAGARADVLVCGASFAGLAVARELAGSGADVLVLDRYEVGERATSACAAPTPWLHAMGVEASIRSELPYMRFTTPHGSVRYRLPWSWSAFDYRALCELLAAQSDARFDTAKVERRTSSGVMTDRGEVRAPLVVDALGWRRVLGKPGYQPPDAPLSRGLEVHPPHGGGGDELHCWVDRSLVRRGYGWHVPAGDEVRIGVGSYDPRRHVKEATVALAEREAGSAVRFQGNWFPHRLRPAADGGTFFAGDSAGHCFPLSGEGIRTAFYFGTAAGREIRAVLSGEKPRDGALRDYAAFSAAHAPAFRRALRLQRLVPALPPRALALGLRAFQPFVDRAFTWYLAQAHPATITGPSCRSIPPTSATTTAASSPSSSRTGAPARS